MGESLVEIICVKLSNHTKLIIYIFFFLFFLVNCTFGDIRTPLLGGTSESEGLVEVCINGSYYPVSLDSGGFSVREATIICKQLKLGSGKSACSKLLT